MLRIVILVGPMMIYCFDAVAQKAGCAECERIEQRAAVISQSECAKLTGAEVKFCETDAETIAVEAEQLGVEQDLQNIEEEVVPGSPAPRSEDGWKKLQKSIQEFEQTYGIRFLD